MKNIEKNNMYQTFVAVVEDRVAGMIGLRKLLNYESDHLIVQISALVIFQKYRGRGFGKSLVAYAEEWARSEGARGIFLTSGNRPERKDAHRFYERLDYKNTGFRFTKMFE